MKTIKTLAIIAVLAASLPSLAKSKGAPVDPTLCRALTQMQTAAPKSADELRTEIYDLQSELDEAKVPEIRKLQAELENMIDLEKQLNEACGN